MSIDTRLDRIVALLAEAKSLIRELCDESPPFTMHLGLDGVRHSIDDARHHINEAHRRAENVVKDAS